MTFTANIAPREERKRDLVRILTYDILPQSFQYKFRRYLINREYSILFCCIPRRESGHMYTSSLLNRIENILLMKFSREYSMSRSVIFLIENILHTTHLPLYKQRHTAYKVYCSDRSARVTCYNVFSSFGNTVSVR